LRIKDQETRLTLQEHDDDDDDDEKENFGDACSEIFIWVNSCRIFKILGSPNI